MEPEQLLNDPNDVRDGPEVQLFAAERLAFFTDAVVAIAITLLALELQVPEGDSWGEVRESIGRLSNEYIAFLISFVIIAAAWTGHHAMFRYVTRSDGRLMLLNIGWLLMIVVAPFVTRAIVDDRLFFPVGFLAYATVQVMLAGLMLLMVRHASRQQLFESSTPAAFVSRLRIRLLVPGIPFLLSIPAAFVPGVGQKAFILWVAGPSLLGAAFGFRRRLRRRAEARRPGRGESTE